MQEWKVRQAVYHRLNPSHDDDLSNFDIVISQNVVEDAIKYFTTTELGWVYPAKSYVVAICYARWIAENFSEEFYTVLDDRNLLFGNDPYFKPYSDASDIYNAILAKIGLMFDETKGIVPDVRRYFNAEFDL
jgi:hypothetical protein